MILYLNQVSCNNFSHFGNHSWILWNTGPKIQHSAPLYIIIKWIPLFIESFNGSPTWFPVSAALPHSELLFIEFIYPSSKFPIAISFLTVDQPHPDTPLDNPSWIPEITAPIKNPRTGFGPVPIPRTRKG